MPFLGTRGAGSNRAFGYAGAAKPNQVTGLTATDFGTSRAYNNGRIDLSWTAPANNGATISGYLIERSTDNSTYSTLVANTGTSGTTYSDTGLNSAQIYYYKISAINAAGTGDSSSASSATATTVPQAPTIGTPICASGQAYTGSANISVAFTAGATGGKAISSYTATSSSSATGSGASSPVAVSQTVGSSYTYTVIATNANGASTASSTSSSVLAASVPQAPTIGSATGGNASATVAYTANATGGSAITTFTATSSPGSSTGTGSSPITVSGLTNGTAYTFTVTATNIYGTSVASSASNSVTPSVPGSFESIATFTNTGTNTYTFSSIPQTYKSLQIRMCVTTVTNGSSIQFRPNGADPAYSHWIKSNNGSVTAGFASGYGQVTDGVGNTRPGVAIIDVIDYASTTKNKTIRTFAGANANAAASDHTFLASNLVNATTAITSINITTGANTNFTSIALYGVK